MQNMIQVIPSKKEKNIFGSGNSKGFSDRLTCLSHYMILDERYLLPHSVATFRNELICFSMEMRWAKKWEIVEDAFLFSLRIFSTLKIKFGNVRKNFIKKSDFLMNFWTDKKRTLFSHRKLSFFKKNCLLIVQKK